MEGAERERPERLMLVLIDFTPANVTLQNRSGSALSH